MLPILPIKFHLIPDTPKTSATFSVKKATICAEFFGTFYRHRKYIKNITKLRECQIISTENFTARHITHGKQTCLLRSFARAFAAPLARELLRNITRSSLACRCKPILPCAGCCGTRSVRLCKKIYTRTTLRQPRTMACTRQGSPLFHLRCRFPF